MFSDRKVKYFIYQDDMAGIEFPVLFPFTMNHDDAYNSFIYVKSRLKSAGFVKTDNTGNLVAHGYSETLGVEARPEDTEIINKWLGLKE